MKLILMSLIVLHTFNVCAQEDTPYLHFDKSIPVTKIALEYADDKHLNGIFIGDTTDVKPLIIFIQGSEPRPLFVNLTAHKLNYFLLPKEIFGLTEAYHYLVLSKPGISLMYDDTVLTNYNVYDKSSAKPPQEYLINNHLEFYTSIYLKAIHSFSKKTYVDSNEIILLGHSQGSRIATKVANKTPLVSTLIYLSCDPLGRFYPLSQQADTTTQAYLSNDEWLEKLIQFSKEDSTQTYWGETHRSWLSFSEILIDDIQQLDIPIFVGFGEKDKSCINCNLFYTLKYTEQMDNLSIYAYPKYDHNFFDTSNKPNVNKRKTHHWLDIMRDIETWLMKD